MEFITAFSGPPPPPDPGYVSVPGVGYYRIHKELHTWAEAKAICEAEGGHLLIINSEAEDKAIQQLLKQEQNIPRFMFIGFNDMNKEGSYITIFGDPVSAGYARWNPGQPDNGGNVEDCGSIYTDTVGLNDLPCSSKVGFICEQRRWSVNTVPVGVRRRREAWALALLLACVARRGLNEGLL
ncbi:C-type lectin 37Db [Gryllus bimaculatus]|nr:C-type lectin 37Db [Gryllus bimaculatus]